MTPAMAEAIIPVVALLVTFGCPVALVFVWKWFKLKDRELTVDAEIRRTSGAALEQRVQRLESIILALDADVRAKIGAGAMPSHLMEAPPSQAGLAPGPDVVLPIKSR